MLRLSTLMAACFGLLVVTQTSSPSNDTLSLSVGAVGKGVAEEACPSLRSKRFISDGLCSSPFPVHEVVCADRAPTHGRRRGGPQPVGAASPQRQRCVEAGTRRRRVELLCQDGSRRFYHVRLVKSCRPRGQAGGGRRRQRRPPAASPTHSPPASNIYRQ